MPEPDLPFTQQAKRDMRQLNQVSTGANSTMFRDDRHNAMIDRSPQLFKKFYRDTRPSNAQCVQSNKHRGKDILIGYGLPHTNGMTMNKIALKGREGFFTNQVGGHWSEPSVHPIDDLRVQVLI